MFVRSTCNFPPEQFWSSLLNAQWLVSQLSDKQRTFFPGGTVRSIVCINTFNSLLHISCLCAKWPFLDMSLMVYKRREPMYCTVIVKTGKASKCPLQITSSDKLSPRCLKCIMVLCIKVIAIYPKMQEKCYYRYIPDQLERKASLSSFFP